LHRALLDKLLGYEVLADGKRLGEIKDYFHNNAQYVLVISTVDGRELLVPYVDYYVQALIPDPGVLMLVNAEPLVAALDSEE